MGRFSAVCVLVTAVACSIAQAGGAQTPQERLDVAIAQIMGLPYQPAYVPAGVDSAFPVGGGEPNLAPVPNTAPAQDYTSGSIPGSPDHPEWPLAFQLLTLTSGDGAKLFARVAIHQGVVRPGIVVVHGFNTNAKESVIRWAAMLYANGYNVIASDQRDFKAEHDDDAAYPSKWPQTFGWKEATDVLAAGQYLKSQFTVSSVGVVGFSLGAQDTVLGLSLDPAGQVFTAGLTFSGPGDQNWQIWSTRQPSNCTPPSCTYPATTALVALVVPPYTYTDACDVVADAAAVYHVPGPSILAQDKAYRRQQQVSVPLLNFYSADDSLVDPQHAAMMAGYGTPLRRTFLLQQGEHAYFFDRWWQQRAMLVYFKALLPESTPDVALTYEPTVNQTPGGAATSTQLVSLAGATPAAADAIAAQAPPVCGGTPTGVVVRSFTATRRGGRVVLRWRTANEAGLAGFHVYRDRTRLDRRLIPAAGPASGRSYTLTVTAARSRAYSLEAVRLDGSRTRVARAQTK